MFTKEEFEKFFNLVQMSGSHDQMDRFHSRLEMPKFVDSCGRHKCDEMWKLIESGVTPSTLEID